MSENNPFLAPDDIGKRFTFGENWMSYCSVLDDDRISEAGKSLCDLLRVKDLHGKTFLDIGSGSGLFSLAAARLGARVRSFDVDAQSVACTEEMKRCYAPDAPWEIGLGDILNETFLQSLGVWDVVYAWGVLHHTGEMWRAMDYAGDLVKEDGALFISIYNDQGIWSRVWLRVKRFYNSSALGRWLVTIFGISYFVVIGLKSDLLHWRNPLASYRNYRKKRGMSVWHDYIDWFGGYPFEVAKPCDVVDFFVERGFALTSLRTVGASLGTNQYVFRRDRK